MSSFTIKLKSVIENLGGEMSLGSDGVSIMTGADIGLDHYTIFDATYRPHLNGMIIDHYYNREIGMETVDMFQLAMRRKMNEIMPYYNKMYLSTQLEFDPLKTVDLSTVTHATDESTNTADGSGTSTSDTNAKARTVNSSTPQTQLSEDEDYATAGVDSKSDTTSTGSSTQNSTNTNNGTSDSTVSVSGFQAVPATLISMYRDTLINVDLMVITALEECFMQVWDTGDTYYSEGFVI